MTKFGIWLFIVGMASLFWGAFIGINPGNGFPNVLHLPSAIFGASLMAPSSVFISVGMLIDYLSGKQSSGQTIASIGQGSMSSFNKLVERAVDSLESKKDQVVILTNNDTVTLTAAGGRNISLYRDENGQYWANNLAGIKKYFRDIDAAKEYFGSN